MLTPRYTIADFFPHGIAYGYDGTAPQKVRGAGGRRYILGQIAAALAAGKTVSCPLPGAADQEALLGALRLVGVRSPPVEEPAPPREEQLFHTYDFAAVVGLWLDHGRRDAASLLSPFISTEGFSFTVAEFVDLRKRLDATQRHFARYPNVSRALDDLNTGLFRFQDVDESRDFVVRHVSGFLDRSRKLHRAYLLAINGHARADYFTAVQLFEKRQAQLSRAAALLRGARRESGRSARRDVQEVLRRLARYRTDHPDAELPAPTRPEDIDAFLMEEGLRLPAELAELPRKLQSAALSLSALTSDAAPLEALHRDLTTLIRDVDEAGLYQLPVSGQAAATTPRQLKLLEQLIDRLANTQLHLSGYADLHRRRQYWYAQPAHLRRLLGPLLELPPTDWDTAFQGWYLEQALLRATQLPAPPLVPDELAELAEHWLESLPLPESKWRDLLCFRETPGADFRVSLSGDMEADLCLRPFSDPRAAAFRLAGIRGSELVFQQPFAALRPPAFRAGAQVRGFSESGQPRFEPKQDGSVEVFLPAAADYDAPGSFFDDWPRYVCSGKRLLIHHDWEGDAVTRALLSDGITSFFLAAVLIRALEYGTASPFDATAFAALGAEVRGRYQVDRPTGHPLAESVVRMLRSRSPDHFLETRVPWRDAYLPALITGPDGRKTVLLPHGRLGSPGDELLTEALRQRELRHAGYRLVVMDAIAFWRDPENAVAELATAVTER